jgi:exodeoxyribonuclease VII large subunit
MESAIQGRLENVRLLLSQFAAQNLERNVRTFLQPLSQRTDYAREGLVQGFRLMLTGRGHRLALSARELAACSPLAVLQRGYAMVTHEASGKVLVSSEDARRGDTLSIRLARGSLRAAVEETHAGEK